MQSEKRQDSRRGVDIDTYMCFGLKHCKSDARGSYLRGAGIDNFGHLGGFLGGYLTTWYLISNLSVCASKCRLGPLVWRQKCEQVQKQYIAYQQEARALPSKSAQSADQHAREVLDRKREKLIIETEAALAATPAIFSKTFLKQDLKRMKRKLENNPLL